MINFPLEWSDEEYKDVGSINYWKKMITMFPNDTKMQDFARSVLQKKARDHARTPMQWTSEKPNAGFCDKDVKPWMRVNDDFEQYNAEAENEEREDDALSVLQFWKRGLKNRKLHKSSFVYGEFELLGPEDNDNPLFAYKRWSGDEAWVVILNFSPKEQRFEIPSSVEIEKWVTGTYNGIPGAPLKGDMVLRAWEGLLGQC